MAKRAVSTARSDNAGSAAAPARSRAQASGEKKSRTKIAASEASRAAPLEASASSPSKPIKDSPSVASQPGLPADDVGALVARTKEVFAARGLRFTDLREQVYAEIAATKTSIGAYDILERLAAKGTRLAPISVYRSIDALMEAGVINRLDSKNAYFARQLAMLDASKNAADKPAQTPVFLSCKGCGIVLEISVATAFSDIAAAAEEVGFATEMKSLEVVGLCADCQTRS
ncbi:MAG: transcriptional repressor [Pseudomonadota bacterium]